MAVIDASGRCIAVAYSGGRDSTALLHATLMQAALIDCRVFALHVHHGLSPHADRWQAHCEAQCAGWFDAGLPVKFVSRRIADCPRPGDSVEAWARQARYEALRAMALAQGAETVLLAHHQRDQAETFVLQALRGGGLCGLSAMPLLAERQGVTWLRPWLARSHSDIDTYVRDYALNHIEDDSNNDPRFARNRLRLQVWPMLEAAFEHAQASLAASAGWAQEAAACLDELATIDLAQVAEGPFLNVAQWTMLSLPRRSNALRAWLAAAGGGVAAASLVGRLMAELSVTGAARWPAPLGELRCHRGRLRWHPLPTPQTSISSSLAPETKLEVRRAGRYRLSGWRGWLRVTRVKEGGVPLAFVAWLDLRQRSGSDRFQAGPGRPPRSLKKQFQSAGLASWERHGPIICSGGLLLYVPGLGLDARMLALPGQAQVALQWESDLEEGRDRDGRPESVDRHQGPG